MAESGTLVTISGFRMIHDSCLHATNGPTAQNYPGNRRTMGVDHHLKKVCPDHASTHLRFQAHRPDTSTTVNVKDHGPSIREAKCKGEAAEASRLADAQSSN